MTTTLFTTDSTSEWDETSLITQMKGIAIDAERLHSLLEITKEHEDKIGEKSQVNHCLTIAIGLLAELIGDIKNTQDEITEFETKYRSILMA